MRDKFPQWPMVEGVTPLVGEPMRFLVESWTDSKKRYLVDLESLGGHGACGCEQFQMRCLPRWNKDRAEGRPKVARRCKHVVRALIWQAEMVNRKIAEATNKRLTNEK